MKALANLLLLTTAETKKQEQESSSDLRLGKTKEECGESAAETGSRLPSLTMVNLRFFFLKSQDTHIWQCWRHITDVTLVFSKPLCSLDKTVGGVRELGN